MKSNYKFENNKVIEQVNVNGTTYTKIREIEFANDTYVEFRNNEQGRIIFMLQKDGEYEEITDERKLRRMLENNYIIKNNIDII